MYQQKIKLESCSHDQSNGNDDRIQKCKKRFLTSFGEIE